VNCKRCPILQSSTSADFTPAVEHSEHLEPIANGQEKKKKRRSHVSTIRSKNLASINADEDGNEIVLNFDNGESEEDSNLMVVVTGETGSGKSLFVSKAAELVTGGKMAPSLLNGSKSKSAESTASVELGT
jgi:polynucleotide 5'-kinase involved in rRNA processing